MCCHIEDINGVGAPTAPSAGIIPLFKHLLGAVQIIVKAKIIRLADLIIKVSALAPCLRQGCLPIVFKFLLTASADFHPGMVSGKNRTS
jgi:hypothetical protein